MRGGLDNAHVLFSRAQVGRGSVLQLLSGVPVAEQEALLTEGGLDLGALQNLSVVCKPGNTVLRRDLEQLMCVRAAAMWGKGG